MVGMATWARLGQLVGLERFFSVQLRGGGGGLTVGDGRSLRKHTG